MTRTTDINSATLEVASRTLPDNSPVYMLNLLRYKEYADYNNAAGPSPCSGREIYMHRYVREFTRIAAADGVKVLFLGSVGVSLVAPDGELKHGKLDEQKYTNKADTYGQIERLVRVLPDYPLPPGPVSILYPRNRQLSPRVRLFIDWVVQQFALAATEQHSIQNR